MKRIVYLFLTILAGPILSAVMPAPGPHDTPAPYPPPPVEGEIIPLFVTGYSWELGGVNCDHDCRVTSIGFPTEAIPLAVLGGDPGNVIGGAACPSDWVHLDIVRVVTIGGVGTFWCLDSFGSPEYQELRWIVGTGWVYHIDLALLDPSTAPYGLAYGYSYTWEWVYDVCFTC